MTIYCDDDTLDALISRGVARKLTPTQSLDYKLLGLPDIEIEILELRRAGLTLQNIAVKLDMSLGNVWSIEQLARGKIEYALKLREMLLSDERKRRNFICLSCNCEICRKKCK